MSQLNERGIVFQVFGFAAVGCMIVFAMQLCQEQSCVVCGVVRDAARVHWAFLGLVAWVFDKVRTMFEKRSEIRQKLIQDEIARKLGLALKKMADDEVYASVSRPRKDRKQLRKMRERLLELARDA